MNHLIGKIKLRGNSPKYRKMISGKVLFEKPSDLQDHIEYSSDHKLDEDSWFGIEEFSKKDYCLEVLKSTFNSTEYDTLETNQVDKLDFICSYQNSDEYYFQNITKSKLIKKKTIRIGDGFEYKEDDTIITINPIADALYLKEKDILYFKKLASISSIFKGIENLYREATKTETKVFLENDFIKLTDDFCEEKVGKANRHRIAMANDTLNNLKIDQKEMVISYIKDYCKDLEYDKEHFKIQSDDDLRKLLYGIEQRYYTTPIGNEKRCANSIVRI
nr:hypothetical protein NZ312_16225 [Clostridioides difficile]